MMVLLRQFLKLLITGTAALVAGLICAVVAGIFVRVVAALMLGDVPPAGSLADQIICWVVHLPAFVLGACMALLLARCWRRARLRRQNRTRALFYELPVGAEFYWTHSAREGERLRKVGSESCQPVWSEGVIPLRPADLRSPVWHVQPLRN